MKPALAQRITAALCLLGAAAVIASLAVPAAAGALWILGGVLFITALGLAISTHRKQHN
ncbi:hypothetical protein [Leifsonia sp. NPDC058230]|uniref:hypothetical protein n=1 Tax=Leifsonia sp. NPDC058230 TaxID=3346391 RepID=UPI0036DBD708